jgi:hypothetical protein
MGFEGMSGDEFKTIELKRMFIFYLVWYSKKWSSLKIVKKKAYSYLKKIKNTKMILMIQAQQMIIEFKLKLKF